MSIGSDQMMEQEKSKLNTWTKRALSVSVILHIIFLIAAASIVALSTLHKPQAQFASEPPSRPKLEPRKLELKVKVTDLQKRSSRPKLQPRMVAMAPANIALPQIKTPPQKIKRKVKRNFATVGVSGFGSGIGGGLGTGFGGGMGGGLPTMLSGRCTTSDRYSRLRANGGKKQSETAVVDGLRWLKATQGSDGSWGSSYKGAMTGLALLAFLGHCETHRSPEFGESVQKGIDFLVKSGKDQKGKLSHCDNKHSSYAHGIATYALAEAYTLCKISKIQSVLKDAVGIIVDGQGGDGGWDYGYSRKSPSDTSVTGWQMQALKAAKTTGKKFKGLDKSMDRAMDYVEGAQRGDGMIGYRGANGGGWNLTGAGIFGLQMWGKGNSKEVRKGVDAILDAQDKLDYRAKTSLYGWYYNTMALFQKGGMDWKKWNRMFQGELLDNQNADGSWKPEGGGQTDAHAKGDGTHFRTCLCILMLEVYYRYLPATG
jgi:hypothetical protein